MSPTPDNGPKVSGWSFLDRGAAGGDHVHYSEEDYPVVKDRQGIYGETDKVMEEGLS